MTTIRLFADDQKLRVAHDGPCVVSGSRNATMLHVQFGRGWSDYEKSAVFYTTRDDKVYEVLLDEGKCTIPHEVLSLTADLYIGVRGVSSEHQKVKPTSLVKYKVEKGAPVGDGTTVEPTPDVYQQILMRLNDLEVGAGGEVDPVKVTQIVKDYLAEHPGPKGDKGDPGEPGRDGVDGKDGADGKSAYQYAQEAGYTGTEAEFAQDLAADNIPVPSTAQVGQTIVVKEVDGNGKPVSWECVDLAGGTKLLVDHITEQEIFTSEIPDTTFSEDLSGNSFCFKNVMVRVSGTAVNDVDTDSIFRIWLNGLRTGAISIVPTGLNIDSTVYAIISADNASRCSAITVGKTINVQTLPISIDNITAIRVSGNNYNKTHLAAGASIKIWGWD